MLRTHTGGVQVQLHTLLIPALDRGKWSDSWSGCLTPEERSPRGWVGSTASMDTVAQRKSLYLCWESNPSHSACSLVTIPTELPHLPLQITIFLNLSYNIIIYDNTKFPTIKNFNMKIQKQSKETNNHIM
jgi:hypothetical protein